jgi:hypothetical protein
MSTTNATEVRLAAIASVLSGVATFCVLTGLGLFILWIAGTAFPAVWLCGSVLGLSLAALHTSVFVCDAIHARLLGEGFYHIKPSWSYSWVQGTLIFSIASSLLEIVVVRRWVHVDTPGFVLMEIIIAFVAIGIANSSRRNRSDEGGVT